MNQERETRFFAFVPFLAFACLLIALVMVMQKRPSQGKDREMSSHKGFATALDCMDGRTKEAVIRYMKSRYSVRFVDFPTDAGTDKVLADCTDICGVEKLKKLVGISVHDHGSCIVAIIGHEECAGNPASKDEQIKHLQKAKETVESFGFDVDIVLLWVEPIGEDDWENATVEEIELDPVPVQ